ncbi:hypothetical protein [Lysobacter gummosus]|uniref:hypothetical protein n=1 Tax=Lysobacter gummosus TaxID=262324 RepID=UPI003635D1D4
MFRFHSLLCMTPLLRNWLRRLFPPRARCESARAVAQRTRFTYTHACRPEASAASTRW